MYLEVGYAYTQSQPLPMVLCVLLPLPLLPPAGAVRVKDRVKAVGTLAPNRGPRVVRNHAHKQRKSSDRSGVDRKSGPFTHTCGMHM